MSTGPRDNPFVGRGGLKLAHALDTFNVDPTGLTCADFGCNVGGFTDCLLQGGASRVYAVDTGYGSLDYGLRMDERVIVMERTNALHAEPPEEKVDLIAIDLGWTPQSRAIPPALRWLSESGQIISLIKPHYEASHGPEREELDQGVLNEISALRVQDRVMLELPALGVRIEGVTRSPITGGAGKGRKTGNIEFLVLLTRAPSG